MRSPSKVLVIGATGNQGGGAIRHCIAAGHVVRALVRDCESEKAAKLKRDHSVALIQGDIDDIDSLRRGLEDIDALFFIITQSGFSLEHRRAKNVIDAVRGSRTTSTIIFSSALWTGQHETFPNWGPNHPMYEYWTGKHESEEMVRSAGVKHWVIIRPAMFLQDFIPPISSHLFPDLEGSRNLRVGFGKADKINVVDGSDVGLVAAAAISNPDQYSGETIELSLPPHTIQEIADAMAGADSLPLKVTYVDINELATELGERLVAAQRLFKSLGNHPRTETFSNAFSLTEPRAFFSREYSYSSRQ